MIRTRFAPSPTGELHIGGARTALFNFLLARSAGEQGRFILRIDDTDAERSRREFEFKLMEDLRWLGLDWDEGPDGPGGVPCRQSERLGLYAEWMSRLREAGAVYPCFCSDERLGALRRDQAARGEPPRYDGRCRALSSGEAERRIASGEKPCWRFALGSEPIVFEDAVRGRQAFPAGTIGDFVLERSDGMPTYLFASAVDDLAMEITHVVRGDEHVPNTARQLAILDRLGCPRPVFAHIPMILSADRQKLSKRTGSTSIREYRERGFLPEGLVAYLATLSWSPGDSVSPFSLESLAGAFSLDRISRSSPLHDESHLLHWQREAMRRRGTTRVRQEIAERDPRFEVLGDRLDVLIGDLLDEHPLTEELEQALAFLVERPTGERMEWMPILASALGKLEPWTEEELNGLLRAFMRERGMRGKEFFHPLRLLLTGRERGAALPLVLLALGREEVVSRLAG